MLCCSLGNENSDAGHIKCARGPHVPYPWCRATVYASCFLFSFWVRVGLRCAMVSCAFEVATWLKACFGFQPFADNRWLIVQPSFPISVCGIAAGSAHFCFSCADSRFHVFRRETLRQHWIAEEHGVQQQGTLRHGPLQQRHPHNHTRILAQNRKGTRVFWHVRILT